MAATVEGGLVIRDRWERWAPLSGIAYVVLFIVALFITGGGAGDTPSEYSSYYADSGNRNKEIFGFFLLVGAALVFLWFVAALRGILVRAEGESARWTALAFGSGVASATLLCASASLFVAPAFLAEDGNFELDPSAGNMFSNAGYATFMCSVMTGAMLVFATSIVSLRTLVLPRWLALVGFLVAAVLLFAAFFFPLFVWMAWLLAVSIVLILRSARVEGWRRRGASGAG
jgi:hypothetical protein